MPTGKATPTSSLRRPAPKPRVPRRKERAVARNPRRRAITASVHDAPIEAWQQAMLPKLKADAEALEMIGADECAFVFLCLLRLKPFEEIGEFKNWVPRVTDYPRYEIDQFVARAIEGFLIAHILFQTGRHD